MKWSSNVANLQPEWSTNKMAISIVLHHNFSQSKIHFSSSNAAAQ